MVALALAITVSAVVEFWNECHMLTIFLAHEFSKGSSLMKPGFGALRKGDRGSSRGRSLEIESILELFCEAAVIDPRYWEPISLSDSGCDRN